MADKAASSWISCAVGSLAGSPDLQAVHVLACDPETGDMRLKHTVRGVRGTSFLTLAPDGGTLYSAIRLADPPAKRSALVAFSVSGGALGEMRTVAELPCEPPCHLSLSPDGRFMAFAAYFSATAGTVRLTDGRTAIVVHDDALRGPNARRQDKAHAHCTVFTPDGARLGIVDLGLDRIFFYDPVTMLRDDEMTIVAPPGLGPRHALFSHEGTFLYTVGELGNTVSSYAFDGRSFTSVCTESTLPDGWVGETKASAIRLTGDGELLMASNRGHDSIAFFAVDRASGVLTPKGVCRLCGRSPRDFRLLPGERYALVGHEASDEIQMYAFDREICTLSPVGAPVKAWKPVSFCFL